ncbi:MAG: GNAT family N-acetyltransferase [Ruminococcus sp.]|nr:GNAT family N-acetyltransferase [Ruminococcus sp.]
MDFFLKHHSMENIVSDIEKGLVWLIEKDGCAAGTVTVKENAINRLFVLPQYEHRGIGSTLMDFAEEKILQKYGEIHVDSSLPAKQMYVKRGYTEKRTCNIAAENGDVLVYDEMKKIIGGKTII